MMTDFTHFLLSMGIVPKDTTDETISFEYNGWSYLFVSDKSDPYYIRLILPNIENINNANEIDVYKIINQYNNRFKAVKMRVVENSIWLSIEQFLYSRENSNNLFLRLMKILETVITEYRISTRTLSRTDITNIPKQE